MKKLFIILVASMMAFACGNKNEGVEYIQKAQKAMVAGDEATAVECMQKYYEWCLTATPEELEETSDALAEFAMTYQDEIDNFDFDAAVESYQDALEAATKNFEDAMDAAGVDAEEVAAAAQEAAEEAAEQAAEAAEAAAEAAEEAAEAAAAALKGLFE